MVNLDQDILLHFMFHSLVMTFSWFQNHILQLQILETSCRKLLDLPGYRCVRPIKEGKESRVRKTEIEIERSRDKEKEPGKSELAID